MGHYASEMMGPYTGPTNEERHAAKLTELQGHWDWGKKLLKQGHQPSGNGGSYTCPHCFAKVNFWFLADHDEQHESLVGKMREIARWTQPGLIG